MISFSSFSDELVKIAGLREGLIGVGKKLKLLETPAEAAMRTVRKVQKEVPGPSASAVEQLKKMKLQRQLAEMKKARGLA